MSVGRGVSYLMVLSRRPPPSPHWSATGLPDGRGHGRIVKTGSVKRYLAVNWAPLSPPYTQRVRGKAGRKGWQRSGNTGQLLYGPSSAANPRAPIGRRAHCRGI